MIAAAALRTWLLPHESPPRAAQTSCPDKPPRNRDNVYSFNPFNFCINQTGIWEHIFNKVNRLKCCDCQNPVKDTSIPSSSLIVRFFFPLDILSQILNDFSPACWMKICWPIQIFITIQYTKDKFINRKLERLSWENTKAQRRITQDEQLAFFLLVELQFINFLSLWVFCTILGNFQI